MATRTDANGKLTCYGYAQRSELTSIGYASGSTCPGSPSVSYSYDANGNRLQMVDSSGTTSYVYDTDNRPTSVIFPGSKTVSYTYDAAGNRQTMTQPGSKTVTFGYDARNRPASVKDWNNQTTTSSYTRAGMLYQATYPSGTGVVSAYAYDAANRLQSVTHQKNGTTLASASYLMDKAGNRTQKITNVNGTSSTENYAYDRLNRLSCATTAGAGSSPCSGANTTSLSYDGVGNRTGTVATNGGGTATTGSEGYNNANRLGCAWGSGTQPNPCSGTGNTGHTFDQNGNWTSRGTADSFAWDQENRLTSATMSGVSSSYTYNGDGLRLSRTSGGTTTNFTSDVASGLPTVVDDGANQYVYGAGIGPLEQVTGSGTLYFLADGLGSTLALINSSGSIMRSYSYDAFGNVTGSSGTQPTGYQFAGPQTDLYEFKVPRSTFRVAGISNLPEPRLAPFRPGV